ncbi:ANTAR domain-containing response regulator [Vibrio proteolyticus]|uniref:ANTAR domain-containing protein n=1 Tax=Vibrio proteolyticus NBRC 13287 TaxID=1219065 RepID=U3BKS7_VIBPR|nr:ANTAR domain-containing protein [Vibrio proteolyticus]GAD67233.1 hypothetical protein VPR01S_07_00320 [Vibrio proteolyticus NBRC 13287]
MARQINPTSLIICCEHAKEQAQLRTQLVKNYDQILTCRLAQLELLLDREPTARLLVHWYAPCAELRSIVEVCRQRKVPLLLLIKSISTLNFKSLEEPSDYVLLPHSMEGELSVWLEYAARVRVRYQKMCDEIASLNTKIEDRKVIERAKGLIMKMHKMDEESAYQAMRNSAMKTSQPLSQIAKNILTTLETLG